MHYWAPYSNTTAISYTQGIHLLLSDIESACFQLSVCTAICVYSYLCVQLSVCTAICVYSYLCVQLSVCTAICVYSYLCVQLSVCTAICVYSYLCVQLSLLLSAMSWISVQCVYVTPCMCVCFSLLSSCVSSEINTFRVVHLHLLCMSR